MLKSHLPSRTVGEEGYLSLLQQILHYGYYVNNDRTGTGTIVYPTPVQLHFPDVGKDFPLFTTKYVSFNMLAVEMIFFINGYTNTKKLRELGSDAMADMWDKWAENNGALGPVYGAQWRNFTSVNGYGVSSVDQLKQAIRMIKENPTSRRIIVSAWNPVQIDMMALPPCHLMFQFTCEPIRTSDRMDRLEESWIEDGKARSDEEWEELMEEHNIPKYKLHLHLTQRSCDMFLGVPFNVAQYALLLLMVTKVTNTVPGDFTWTGVNAHIYQDHTEAVVEQLDRLPKSSPIVKLDDDITDIEDFRMENIHLAGYNHHPKIKADVSV